MHPTKFLFIWPSGFRGEEFKKINQSETRRLPHAILVSDWSISKNLLL
jgi:hypothetical protein